jgi:hypothetical protein
MAKKKQGPSMSAAIRDVLKENPNLTAKEVVSALADKGIQVKEGLVTRAMMGGCCLWE